VIIEYKNVDRMNATCAKRKEILNHRVVMPGLGAALSSKCAIKTIYPIDLVDYSIFVDHAGINKF